MIELALLLGLGAVGYVLATEKEEFTDSDSSLQARPTSQHTDDVKFSSHPAGHNNMVPFFGSKVTQSMYSGATEGILDNHTGAGKNYFQKQEEMSLYDSKPGTGQVFGVQNETDFFQDRIVTSNRLNNVFPVEQTRVGPGVNDGYTNLPSGGYTQFDAREFQLPKTTDETRIASKPKVSYTTDPVPGAHFVSQPGIHPAVKKNRPDRFAITGMDRVNTTVGAQTAPRIYSEIIMKETNREEIREGDDYMGNAGGRSTSLISSYLRSFTEPFEEFMRLTAEGRPNQGSVQGGKGVPVGPENFSSKVRKDEDVFSDATRFNVPMQVTNAHSEHMGSWRATESLNPNRNNERNTPDILSAFKSNPFTKPLNSL